MSAAIQPPIEQPIRSALLISSRVHQLQVDVGDVINAIQPIRQAGAAKARMRGRDNAPVFGQQAEEPVGGR